MNRVELIDRISKRMVVPKSTISQVLDHAGQVIIEHLATADPDQPDSATIPGLGSLRVITRPGRMGRHPTTGLPIDITERRVVKFTAGSDLLEALRD